MDVDILRHIRRDARMNLSTISRQTGIPVSTIFDRIRANRGGLITRFTALIDFAKLGLPVRTQILIKAAPESRIPLRAFLCEHNSVNALARINNGFDFTTECFFASIRDAEEFVDDLESRFRIVDRQLFHIIDEIAREKMMTAKEE